MEPCELADPYPKIRNFVEACLPYGLPSMNYLSVAFGTLRTNALRAGLTMAIIAFGIMALVGMVTALSSIQKSLRTNLAEMGARTFKVKKKGSDSRYRRRGAGTQAYERINERQVKFFKEAYNYPSRISAHYEVSGSAVVKFRGKETNPQITVKAIDQHFIYTASQDILTGRNFTGNEVTKGANVALLGYALKRELFGVRDAIGKKITIGTHPYRVIGILKPKGSSMQFSGDNAALIPYTNALQNFAQRQPDFTVSVKVSKIGRLSEAVQEAIGPFRVARGLSIKAENDFIIEKSDKLAGSVTENLWFVRVSTYLIGFITLLGAAVGLMNIMLVSVKERTQEIGIRKALGASGLAIRYQFLFEALLISQLGGLIGIVLGLLAGNSITFFFGNQFSLPWGWAIGGFIICLVVGIMAGYYPAKRAALLNPIEALRYE